MEAVTFGVLGPVTAERAGDALALKGPRHRAVLARLILARRRVVPLDRLVRDLWEEPPPRAVGAVRTFVGDLRRALEPDRPPRAPARLLVTEGPGYALRAAPDDVDAWRFEAAVAEADRLPAAQAPDRLRAALAQWRGPAYAEFAGEEWTRGERSRLTELRLRAVERRAEILVDLGRAAEAVPDLDAHLTEHPWREEAWRLLALALYRTGRQADALAVLRRARDLLARHLGVDPGPGLRRLEARVLAQDPDLDPPGEPAEAAARLWARATEAYDRAVAAGSHARLESTVGLLRGLAVTGGGGLQAASRQRVAAIAAAEETGDAELTARVIGSYDVPANWTRSDDPVLARQVVAAAERTLAALPDGPAAAPARCRLLATVAVESRGVRSPRGPRAAAEAERLARGLDDPALLAFALNGAFMQSCTAAGTAPRRDAIGAELVELSARHGMVNHAVLGHLIRLQARSALADLAGADEHADAVDLIAARHERPLAGVFTAWYRALRLAVTGGPYDRAEAAFRSAAALLEGAGMPGLERGLLPLALLGLRLSRGRPADVDPRADWGPYRPWTEPFALLADGRRTEARTALRSLAEPPPDLLYEALCCAEAALALAIGDRTALERTYERLLPAAGEIAGAGSGLLTFGPVDTWLAGLRRALDG
ncbi:MULTISPECIES: BTAD domain-containing putative transcriptional regulator [unclassified Streptomyces]|uniref:AfsR/SARP family transcriptional regulator n=1 Tax=Streptomyces TaxID=1883 RepID=UPI000F92DD47|nr:MULTISPECIES: BTAD domain-containing putative transcriptional regulator [Streptomyces]RSS13595.1 SARP family transcriptional regulator [Streptomyces sp. WAC05458]WMI56047.1 BTAD domain-containing putative transcriptional regulator [Streptomyces rochei]